MVTEAAAGGGSGGRGGSGVVQPFVVLVAPVVEVRKPAVKSAFPKPFYALQQSTSVLSQRLAARSSQHTRLTLLQHRLPTSKYPQH